MANVANLDEERRRRRGAAASGDGNGTGFNLDELVEKLSPKAIARAVVRKHRTTRQGFQVPETPDEAIDDANKAYEHLMKLTTDYLKHHDKKFYGKERDSHELYAGHAQEILEAIFREEGGLERAISLVQEGKADEIITRISRAFEQQDTTRYITGVVANAVPYSDLDKRAEAVGAIQQRLKPLLPPGTEMVDPKYMAKQHATYLREHAGYVDALLRQHAKPRGRGHEHREAA